MERDTTEAVTQPTVDRRSQGTTEQEPDRRTRPEKLNGDDDVARRFNVSCWDRSLGRDTARRGKGQEKKKKRKTNPFYLQH